MDKKELRGRFLALRRAIGPEDRRKADAAICRNIRRMACYGGAEHVALYASDGEEPDLSALFGEPGKRFYFPRYVAETKEYELVGVDDLEGGLVRAKFGLLEPRPELPAAPAGILAQMLFLTPAVACDRHGVRLGRGGGFYDRMLARGSRAVAAIVYGCQMTESLPREPHDRGVGFAVTEEDILEF
ncbi:MAG: 5-formyltetrahydrofolate cyclo-ligase [Lentisphaeria bacterium]|nr:5-formyltetrahydrofolate cyclo-ligase [Lentisphaeria bacterium]